MNNDPFTRLDPHHVPKHVAARTHESAIAEAFARGAGGTTNTGRHADPYFYRCIKCGTNDAYVLWSVDVGGVLCLGCTDSFDAWADAHPGVPYTNFLDPTRTEGAVDDLMAVLHGVEVSTPFGGAR